jgi:hypothetical protein
MKTLPYQKTRNSLLLALMMMVIPTVLFPQQVIKFKTGKVYEVKLLSQKGDSIKYEMVSAPGVVFTVSMDQVEKIWTLNKSTRGYASLTDSAYLKKRIVHYNTMTVMGVVTGLGGAALIIVGASIKTENDHNNIFSTMESEGNKAGKTACIVAGSLVTVAGIVIAIVGANKAEIYRKKV